MQTTTARDVAPGSTSAAQRTPLPEPVLKHPYRGLRARPDGWVPAALTVIFLVGAALRLIPALRADFPLNDGGLFYLMTRELQRSHFTLPTFTAYNGAGLPFGYPPLAFYLAGALASVTGWPLLDVVRVLPAVFSVLTIPVFALLAWTFLREPVERVAAVFAFAMLPRLFTWFIMGGGLPRAPGFLLALLTIHQAYLFYTRREWRYAATTAVVGSLAIATHLENAFFAIYSSALVFAFYGRHRRGVIGTVLIGAGVVALTAPWWGTVVAHHGWQPFISARQASGYAGYPINALRTFRITDEIYVPVLAVLGLLGIAASVAARRFFAPVWFVLVFAVNARNPLTPAMVPLALMIGIAVGQLLVPRLRQLGTAGSAPDGVLANDGRGLSAWPTAVAAATVTALAGYVALATRAYEKYNLLFEPLPVADRAAMGWAASSTPAGTRFVVLSFRPDWFGVNSAAEWFPALAERPSVATVQAYEWLPGKQFLKRITADSVLHACGTQDIGCVERWADQHGEPFSYVYMVKDSSAGRSVLASLRASPRYAPAYENTGVAIFARRPDTPSASAAHVAAVPGAPAR